MNGAGPSWQRTWLMSQGTQWFFSDWFSMVWLIFSIFRPSGQGEDPPVRDQVKEHLKNWKSTISQDVTGCGMHAGVLVKPPSIIVKRMWWLGLEKSKGHPHLQKGKREDLQDSQPHFSTSEGDAENPPGNISKHMKTEGWLGYSSWICKGEIVSVQIHNLPHWYLLAQ